MKEKKEKERTKEEKKKNKKYIFIIIGILLILFLIWFFLKFKVTFKYNNGEEDYQVRVRFLAKIKDKDVKKDLTLPGKTFAGYFETYYLSGSQIERVANNPDAINTICKTGFKLNSEKNKCIAIEKFDFAKTRIMSPKTIEALWSNIDFSINPTDKTIYIGGVFDIVATITGTDDKTVTWSSADSSIATVDNNGKVTGVKVGKTKIIAESHGLRRECNVTVNEKPDEGKVALNSTGKCMVGTSSVTVNATVSNAKDGRINWTYPKCFAHEVNSANTSVKLYRTMSCSDTEETKPTLTAKLNNGATATQTFTYEPTLTVKVYWGSNEVSPSNGEYYTGSLATIVTNVPATFSGKNIKSTTAKSADINAEHDPQITVKTA